MRATRKLATGALALALGAPMLLQAVTTAASADTTAVVTDRSVHTPVGWYYYSGVSESFINNFNAANNYRVVEVHLDNPGSSSPTFTVRLAPNSGATAAVGGWGWYFGKTGPELNTIVGNFTGRIINLSASYTSSGGVRYAFAMVKNTGAQLRNWYWKRTSDATALYNEMVNGGWRPVDIGAVRVGTTKWYTLVTVKNTGADLKTWNWRVGGNTSTINSYATNGMRIVDMYRNSADNYDAIYYKEAVPFWKWRTGFSSGTAVAEYARQSGTRPISVQRYFDGSSTRHMAVFGNNVSGVTQTMRNRMWGVAAENGAWGFQLKQVNGPVLASLQGTKGFEPASSLKVLYHLHHNKVRQGATNKSTFDATSISYRYAPSDPSNGNICPDNQTATQNTTYSNADGQMMWISDNRMTRAIHDRWGRAAMTNTATNLGMTGTLIRHNIGCPTATTANVTTPAALSKVYETVYKDFNYLNSSSRAIFRSRMLNDDNFGWSTGFCVVAKEEAAKLGKSATVGQNFCNASNWIAKGGTYQTSYTTFPRTVSWSGGSLTSLPFKVNGVITPRHFTFVEFFDNGTLTSQTHQNNVVNARGAIYYDSLRPQIRAALLSGW